MTYTEMLALARETLNPVSLGKFDSTGVVAAVLEGKNGKYYKGVNIDLACGLGFCAERSAAAAMIADGETSVRRVVCVGEKGDLMTPCGSCREFFRLLSPANLQTRFLVGLEGEKTLSLAELLPLPWERERG